MTALLSTPERSLRKLLTVAGISKHEKAGTREHRQITFAQALEREWHGDLYLVAYRIEKDGTPLSEAPRMSKGMRVTWEEGGNEILCSVRIGDMDLMGTDGKKRPWTPEEQIRCAKVLNHYPCCWYLTSHGARVLQPLVTDLDPDEMEQCLQLWWPELQSIVREMQVEGLSVDTKCKDWTRLYRMPRVVREHDGGRLENLWATRIRGIDCPAVDPGDCTPPPKPERKPVEMRDWEGSSKYGLKVLETECSEMAKAEPGHGSNQLASCAYSLGGLVSSGHLARHEVEAGLRTALGSRGFDPDKYERTLQRCLNAGMDNPWGPEHKELEPWKTSADDIDGIVVCTFAEERRLKRILKDIQPKKVEPEPEQWWE